MLDQALIFLAIVVGGWFAIDYIRYRQAVHPPIVDNQGLRPGLGEMAYPN